MVTKSTLISRAKKLGISTEGTKGELEYRIAQEQARLDALEDEVEEEVEEEEPEPPKPESKPEEKPVKKAIPRAIPVGNVVEQETAVALKTCVKYVAGWVKLVRGKPVTKPKEVIAALRTAGLVE